MFKEKRGVKLKIWGKGDRLIEGELITVKQNSLLLLNDEGRNLSIDIADIKVIKIVKKSKFLASVAIGCLAGAISVAILGFGIWLIGGLFAAPLMALGEESWEDYLSDATGGGAFYGALIGISIGCITGAVLDIEKTIQIEGMTDSEIQKTLDKLRKYARIRDHK